MSFTDDLTPQRVKMLVDALKYSPDQPRDDHGRFGSGDGGDTSTMWEKPDPVALREIEIGDLVRQGVHRQRAEQVALFKRSDDQWFLKNPNGSQIVLTFPRDAGLSEAQKQQVADRLSSLSAKYPLDHNTSWVINPDINANGLSYGGGHVDINPGVLTDKGRQGNIRAYGRDGNYVHVAADSPVDYIITHEYGHQHFDQVMEGSRSGAVSYWLGRVGKHGYPSSYAMRNDDEAYAEAFAQHVLGPKDERNPLVGALARAARWPK